MINPQWGLPIPFIRRKKVRQIFYLRDGIQIEKYKRDMWRSGVRPIRFLPHLDMIVGEYETNYATYSLEGHPDVEYTEPDLRVTLTDPLVEPIKTLSSANVPWGIQKIDAPKVWSKSQGDGIRVAVVDTGVYSDHPAIKANYKGGVNILSPRFTPQDYNGHGTHVAGIIAGSSSELGVIGVAPKAQIYAVKAFNRKGSANLSDLLSAINWCIEKEINVVNMSFGMEKVSESLRIALQVAHRKGLIMIAASGNQGYTSKIDYPARYPETIGVASISQNGTISRFSNRGKGVDFVAPGDKISSAWLNNSKKEMSGTSMAVPHVSGVVALLLQLNKRLNPEQIRNILSKSSSQLPTLSGLGLINAEKAVQFLEKNYK